jgi:co-chaperonin GroES (HSP10)
MNEINPEELTAIDLSALQSTATAKPISFIESHEEAEVQKIIDQQFVEMCGKRYAGRPCGYHIVLKIYVRPEELKTVMGADGKEVTLYLPPSVTAEDKYRSGTGLVVAMGSQCYEKPRFPAPWCKVGDWVRISRGNLIRTTYRGVALALVADDNILEVIDEPSDWIDGHPDYKT